MAQRLKTKITARRRPLKKVSTAAPVVSAADFNRLEFHRYAVALMPDPADRRPGIAFQVDGDTKRVEQQFCSCQTSGAGTCSHQKELSRVLAAWQNESVHHSFYADFQNGFWHSLAAVLAEEVRETPATIRLAVMHSGGRDSVEVIGTSNRSLLTYISAKLDRARFLERCTQPPEDADVPTRGEVIRDPD